MIRYGTSKRKRKDLRFRPITAAVHVSNKIQSKVEWSTVKVEKPVAKSEVADFLEGTVSPLSIDIPPFIHNLLGTAFLVRNSDRGALWRADLTRSSYKQVLSILTNDKRDRLPYLKMSPLKKRLKLSSLPSLLFPRFSVRVSDYLTRWFHFERSGRSDLFAFIRVETAMKMVKEAETADDSDAILSISHSLQGALILGAMLTTRQEEMVLSMAHSLWAFLHAAHSQIKEFGLAKERVWSVINGLTTEMSYSSFPAGLTQVGVWMKSTANNKMRADERRELLEEVLSIMKARKPMEKKEEKEEDEEEKWERVEEEEMERKCTVMATRKSHTGESGEREEEKEKEEEGMDERRREREGEKYSRSSIGIQTREEKREEARERESTPDEPSLDELLFEWKGGNGRRVSGRKKEEGELMGSSRKETRSIKKMIGEEEEKGKKGKKRGKKEEEKKEEDEKEEKKEEEEEEMVAMTESDLIIVDDIEKEEEKEEKEKGRKEEIEERKKNMNRKRRGREREERERREIGELKKERERRERKAREEKKMGEKRKSRSVPVESGEKREGRDRSVFSLGSWPDASRRARDEESTKSRYSPSPDDQFISPTVISPYKAPERMRLRGEKEEEEEMPILSRAVETEEKKEEPIVKRKRGRPRSLEVAARNLLKLETDRKKMTPASDTLARARREKREKREGKKEKEEWTEGRPAREKKAVQHFDPTPAQPKRQAKKRRRRRSITETDSVIYFHHKRSFTRKPKVEALVDWVEEDVIQLSSDEDTKRQSMVDEWGRDEERRREWMKGLEDPSSPATSYRHFEYIPSNMGIRGMVEGEEKEAPPPPKKKRKERSPLGWEVIEKMERMRRVMPVLLCDENDVITIAERTDEAVEELIEEERRREGEELVAEHGYAKAVEEGEEEGMEGAEKGGNEMREDQFVMDDDVEEIHEIVEEGEEKEAAESGNETKIVEEEEEEEIDVVETSSQGETGSGDLPLELLENADLGGIREENEMPEMEEYPDIFGNGGIDVDDEDLGDQNDPILFDVRDEPIEGLGESNGLLELGEEDEPVEVVDLFE